MALATDEIVALTLKIMKLYKYNVYSLIDKIKSELNGEYTTFHNNTFDFSDAVASVTGWVDEYWRCESLGFTEPLEYTLVSRTAEFDEVLISYNDERVHTMDSDELWFVEKEVEKK